MKKKMKFFAILVIIIFALAFLGPFYVVDEGEQAIIVRMGMVISSANQAGLYMKIPFIDEVVRYPKKNYGMERGTEKHSNQGKTVYMGRCNRPLEDF